MSDRTVRIKNLAIALEALYRTPATAAMYDVEKALDHEVTELKKEQQGPKATNTPTSTSTDYEIPF